MRAIDDEMRFHLDGRIEELMATGLTREEARRRALEAFGDVDRVRHELVAIGEQTTRRVRRREALGSFLRDIRVGARRLRRSPGYAFVALVTLALGIGASVAMFTVLNAVVLTPLPYPEPDRLVRIWPAMNFNTSLSRDVAAGMPSTAVATGISRWGLTLVGDGPAVVMGAAVVDATYFDVFGVRPLMGRVFTAEETEPARSGVVLLGYDTWQTRFGGDADIVGRRIRLTGFDHESREVIGVMPRGHQIQGQAADVWVPLHLPANRTFLNDSTWYVNEVVGRLAPGATVERADAEIRALATRLASEYPQRFDAEVVSAASAVTLLDFVVGDVRGMLWTLLAAVGLVLLIACGNLANLLLARSTGRRRELAVQAAMGASRGRLVRQQLAESAIIAMAGGVAGVLFARVILALVGVAESSGLPRAAALSMDWRVLLFAFALSVGSLLVFGLLPALRTARPGLRDDLVAGTRGAGVGRGAHNLNRALVAAELAMATVLTISAGLVLSSFARLRSVDPGIDTADVLTVEVQPPVDRYHGDILAQYYDDALQRLHALPGVTAVGAIHILPFTSGNWSFPFLAEGHAPEQGKPLPKANFRMITPGYIDAVDQPLIAGRDFDATDRDGARRVIMINRTLAESLWPGQDAIGREIRVYGSIPHVITGVVGDVHQFTLDLAPMPEMYVPIAQWTRGGAAMVFNIEGPRASDLAAQARSIINAIDPDVPIVRVRTLAAALGNSLARRRFIMGVLVAFGSLALLLGGIGVYGVMSHLVGSRLPDFGLRLALGATPREVVRDAMATGLPPTIAGLAAGLVAALAASRLLRGALFGIEPLNIPTYLSVTAVLLAIAALASWLPARRAGRADPISVLRSD